VLHRKLLLVHCVLELLLHLLGRDECRLLLLVLLLDHGDVGLRLLRLERVLHRHRCHLGLLPARLLLLRAELHLQRLDQRAVSHPARLSFVRTKTQKAVRSTNIPSEKLDCAYGLPLLFCRPSNIGGMCVPLHRPPLPRLFAALY
jgi:hypothetical protein